MSVVNTNGAVARTTTASCGATSNTGTCTQFSLQTVQCTGVRSRHLRTSLQHIFCKNLSHDATKPHHYVSTTHAHGVSGLRRRGSLMTKRDNSRLRRRVVVRESSTARIAVLVPPYHMINVCKIVSRLFVPCCTLYYTKPQSYER